MLANYVEDLCKNIKPVVSKSSAPTPYARPPPPKTPRLIDISFAQAVKNAPSNNDFDNQSTARKKKREMQT